MNESEFAELLRFIQERMAAHGFGGLNERIVSDLRMEEAPAFRQVVRYVDILRDELSLGTNETTARTLRRLRRIASSERGRQIGGIDIVMGEGDPNIYGTRVLDLSGLPDLSAILDELSRLVGQLLESRGGEWG